MNRYQEQLGLLPAQYGSCSAVVKDPIGWVQECAKVHKGWQRRGTKISASGGSRAVPIFAPGQVGGPAPKVVLPLHRLTKLMEPDETFDLWGVPLKVVQRGGVVVKLVGPLPESWLTELGAWNDETGEPV